MRKQRKYSVVLVAVTLLFTAQTVQAQGRGRGMGPGGGVAGQPGWGPGQGMGPGACWRGNTPGTCARLGPGQGMGPGVCPFGNGQGMCALPAASGTPLTSAEKDHLAAMREEEKLAHDVYVTLGNKWKVPVFQNVQSAESRHMSVVAQLLTRYELKDPIADTTVGTFNAPKFTKLYQKLVKRGSKSLADAYQVGCLIEELDIADLRAAQKVTSHADIQFVFGNLERASRNHLRAFNAVLTATGGTYQASHLEQAVFDQIANSGIERGGRWANTGQVGNGPGSGMGRGRAARGGPGMGMGMGRGRGGPGMGRRRSGGGPGWGRNSG